MRMSRAEAPSVEASRDGLAELVRAEVQARGWTPRSSVVSRLVRALDGIVAVDADAVREVCRELERVGDLQLAPGGNLVATPVRAVTLDASRWRIFASASSATLDARLAGAWSRVGVRRVRDAVDPELRASVEELHGVVVPAAQWSGLDRAPVADETWLASLPLRPTECEPDGSLEWRAWVLHEGRYTWRRSVEGQLWRARHPELGWRRAWTNGASPASTRYARLDADEEARTRFAVARGAGTPIAMRWESLDDEVALTIDGWLPRAEYRHVALYGAMDVGGVWRIEPEHRAELVQMLTKRLGLVEA